MRDKNETTMFEKLPVKKARELGERERRMRERKAQREEAGRGDRAADKQCSDDKLDSGVQPVDGRSGGQVLANRYVAQELKLAHLLPHDVE